MAKMIAGIYLLKDKNNMQVSLIQLRCPTKIQKCSIKSVEHEIITPWATTALDRL